MHTLSPRTASDRVAALDGLRGLAATAVVLYHGILALISPAKVIELLSATVGTLSGYDRLARLVLGLVSGETAVCIFFVMSGAVLMSGLKRAAAHEGVLRTMPRFVARRALRIYPALIVCLAGMYAALALLHLLYPDIYGDPSLRKFLINMTLYDIQVHGATWTLKAEMLAIPFILFTFVLQRWLGLTALLLFGAGAISLRAMPHYNPGIYALPGWLLYFAAGFMACELANTRIPRALMRNGRWLGMLLGAILLRPLLSMSSLIYCLIQAFCIMILVADLLTSTAGPLARLLTGRLVTFLGKISYSLYLWNVLFLQAIVIPAARHTWVRDHYLEAGLIIGVMALALSIPVSVLSERWLERPFTRLLRPASRSARTGV